MRSRLSFRTKLETLYHDPELSEEENEKRNLQCYFNRPSNTKMKYPCALYSMSGLLSNPADNIHYKNHKKYTVTVIDEDPDSEIPYDILKSFQYSSFDRPPYVVDGLWHFVLTIYY